MENLEHHSGDLTRDAQNERIEQYCAQARELLRSAPDEENARDLAARLCEQFERDCSSGLVVSATRLYLDRWIHDQWHTRETADQQ